MTPMPEPSTQHVAIFKANAMMGSLPIGERFVMTLRADLPRDEAVGRIFRMLKREHPAENPMCWTVEDPDA